MIFQWERPPRLKGYTFVYYETADPHSIMYTRTVTMGENDLSVLINNLTPGMTHYVICLEDDAVATVAVKSHAFELLTNCMEVRTSPYYSTMFAWFLSFMICVALVLLIYSQRRKIQILYFGDNHFLDKIHSDTYNAESKMNQVNQNSTSLKSLKVDNNTTCGVKVSTGHMTPMLNTVNKQHITK